MRPTYALIICILVCASSFDLVSHKQQYRNLVVQPYKTAVGILAVDIVEYLANQPVPNPDCREHDNDAEDDYRETPVDCRFAHTGSQMKRNLDTKAQSLVTNLNTSVTNSDRMRTELDRENERLVAQNAQLEQQLRSNQDQFNSIQIQLTQTERQRDEARTEMNNAQARLNNARSALRDAENNLAKQKKRWCFGKKRRKKRELFTILAVGLGAGLGISYGICNNDRSNAISTARSQVNAAESYVNERQNHLNAITNRYNEIVRNKDALQNTRTNLQNQRSRLQINLSQSRQAWSNVNSFNINLKNVLVHLNTVLGRSRLMAEEIRILINMENLINPLNHIADSIVNYAGNFEDTEYFRQMKKKINDNLPTVRSKLPQYELLIDLD